MTGRIKHALATVAIAICLSAPGVLAQPQVRTQAQAATLTLSAWTSATSLNATQTIFSPGDAGFEAVAIQLTQTTTITGGAITFEYAFDNANFSTVPADAVHDPTSTSWATISLPYTLQASTNKLFVIHTKGWQALRVKLSTALTGTGSVTPNVTFLPTMPVSDVIALSPTAANFLDTATINQGGAALSQTNPLPVVFPGTLVSGAVTSAMAATTSTSVIGGTASNYIYVTNCVASNGSTTVSTDILLQDGSGGTTLYVIPAPAATTATTGGAGAVISFPVPLKVPTSGNALFAANVTTGSSTKISCSGFRSTVSY